MWRPGPSEWFFLGSRGLADPDGEFIAATWDASNQGVAISACLTPWGVHRLEDMRFKGVCCCCKNVPCAEKTCEARARVCYEALC